MAKSKKYKDLASPLMLMALLSIGLISSLSGETREKGQFEFAHTPAALEAPAIEDSRSESAKVAELALEMNQLAEDIALVVSHRVLREFIGQPELRLSF